MRVLTFFARQSQYYLISEKDLLNWVTFLDFTDPSVRYLWWCLIKEFPGSFWSSKICYFVHWNVLFCNFTHIWCLTWCPQVIRRACIVMWLKNAFFCHSTVGLARNTTCAQLPAPLLSPGELIGLEHRAEGQHPRMTETAHSKLGKKSRWTSLEIGLITIVSLFFIIIVALIVLFAVHQKCEL